MGILFVVCFVTDLLPLFWITCVCVLFVICDMRFASGFFGFGLYCV